jgi:hypothetical protein
VRTLFCSLLLTATLFGSPSAKADDLSVLMLHHICHDKEGRSQSACSGFLVGFMAGLQEVRKLRWTESQFACQAISHPSA